MPHGSLVRTARAADAGRARALRSSGAALGARDATASAGVAILAPDTYGWSARALRDGGLRIGTSLLRAPLWPDPQADRGEHRIAYALAPTAGATDRRARSRLARLRRTRTRALVHLRRSRRAGRRDANRPTTVTASSCACASATAKRGASICAAAAACASVERGRCVRASDRGRVARRRRTAELRVARLRPAHVSRSSLSRARAHDRHGPLRFRRHAARRFDRVQARRAPRCRRRRRRARHRCRTALINAYVAEANGFWKKLSQEHLTQPIHDARAQLWSDALVASGVPFDAALAQRCARARTRAIAPTCSSCSPARSTSSCALRARGCKLGIVTQRLRRHAPREDRPARACGRHVDALFLADEMGMVKPDPEIFRLACRTLGQRTGPHRDGRRPLRPRHHRRGRGRPVHGADRHPRDPVARGRPARRTPWSTRSATCSRSSAAGKGPSGERRG